MQLGAFQVTAAAEMSKSTDSYSGQEKGWISSVNSFYFLGLSNLHFSTLYQDKNSPCQECFL